jgi:hypothetical protein
MVSVPENVTMQLTNALAQDMRGFYLDNVAAQANQFTVLLNAELHRPYVMEPKCSVQEIVQHFKVLNSNSCLTTTEEPCESRLDSNSTSDENHYSSCISSCISLLYIYADVRGFSRVCRGVSEMHALKCVTHSLFWKHWSPNFLIILT